MSVKGITPQELAAYGIHNVSEIVYNPSYDLLFHKRLNPRLKDTSAEPSPPQEQ